MMQYFDMPFGDETRKLHIYLPDSYYDTDESYPVMYFFDGQNLFFDQTATYGKTWGLNDFMQSWKKPMIIVGLECGHKEGQRLSEYSPYDINSDFFGGHIDGLGDMTMQWIINEVKPLIDNTYRTYPFREATGIAGSSMGGLMSLYAISKYNYIFSKAACLSSAILSELDYDISSSSLDSNTRIYISWGTHEGRGQGDDLPENQWETSAAQSNKRVESYFQERGASTYLFCQTYGRHTEADWEKQVPLFMDFLWMQ
jgi:predicted alpha/beta superfamily hydrolase